MTEIKHYTNSLYYELILTTKYMRMLGTQVFEQECIDASPDEFSTLDVISCNPGICQRDLAKLILKDRANTGRLLDVLEEKGLIVRTLVERNNRPIKQIDITPKGKDFLVNITAIFKERLEAFGEIISEEEMNKTCDFLRKFREVAGNMIKTQI